MSVPAHIDYDDSSSALLELRGIEPIAPDERYGTAFSQFRIWFGANAVVSSLFTGALGPLVFGLSFLSSFTAILFGTIVAALAVGFSSTLGPRTGLVNILFSRYTFGYRVGLIFGLFNALYCYAWSAVNLVTGTTALRVAFALMGATALGTGNGSYVLWIIVIAAITTLISVLGYNLVHRWEEWSTYASIVVFAILSVALLVHGVHGGSTSSSGGAYWKNWFGMALVSFGFAIGWIPYVSDYSRKLPATTSSMAVFWNAFLGLTLSAVWVESIGAVLTTTSPKSPDVVTAISGVLGNNGWVVVGMLIVGLSTVSNNIPNDYTGGLSVQAGGIHIPRWIGTAIGGALGAIGALLLFQNFANKFEEFLLLISYWVSAWFVLVLYNFLKRGGRYDPTRWDDPTAMPVGIGPTIAFVAALIAAWIGMYPGADVSWNVLGQGLFGTRVGVDFGFVFAIVTALLVRVIVDLVLPDRTEGLPAG
jgi:NCS1 nucleoside transporter family